MKTKSLRPPARVSFLVAALVISTCPWVHAATKTASDNFNTASYSTSGSGWSAAWTETGDDGVYNTGQVQGNFSDAAAEGGRALSIAGNATSTAKSIRRPADMSIPAGNTFTSATLAFTYRRVNLDNGSDWVEAEVSGDGGTSWSILGRYGSTGAAVNDAAFQSVSVAVPQAVCTANFVLRFRNSANTAMTSSDYVRFDQVQVTLTYNPTASLGNLVWNDANNNGIKDASETGLNGVVMELLRDANSNNLIDNSELTAVATTTTATVSSVAGTYQFTGLADGKYAVRIANSNFSAGQALAGYQTSSIDTDTADNQQDNDDNGIQAISFYRAISPVINLTAGSEPTSEDGDNKTDFTVDFGFHNPAPLCKILFLCGEAKPQDADALDHGMIRYIESLRGKGSVFPMLAKTTGASLGLYDIYSSSTELTVNLTDYDAIYVSASCYHSTSTALDNALRDTPRPVLVNTAPAAVGMKVLSTEEVHWNESAHTGSALTQVTNFLLSNPTPTYSPVFEIGDYYAGAQVVLWTTAGAFAAGQDAVFLHYNAGVLAPQGASASHGKRVFLGFHMNAVQQNATNTGQPVPESDWFDPLVDYTAAGKAYLDQALSLGLPATNYVSNGSFENGTWSGATVFQDGTWIDRRTTSNVTHITAWGYDNGAWIESPSRARDGNRFLYLKANNCAWQDLSIDNLTSGLTQIPSGRFYTLSFDWAPFDDTNPTTPGATPTVRPFVELHTGDLTSSATWSSTDRTLQQAYDLLDPVTATVGSGSLPGSPWNSLNWRRARVHFFLPAPVTNQKALQILLSIEQNAGSGGGAIFDNVQLIERHPTGLGQNLMVGNLIFKDGNGNGRYDASEGQDNVTVKLFRSTQTTSDYPPAGVAMTDAAGRYVFTAMLPASYYVHVPASEFGVGKPLNGTLSSSGTATDDANDDNAANGDNGVDNAAPATNGISSNVFALPPGAIGAEAGFQGSMDDIAESSGNMTVDLGFAPPPPTSDFGDYPSFPSASQTASADIRLGTAATDAEAANPTSGSATADDTTGADDEDLSMPNFPPGVATNLTIPVTLTTASLSGNTSRINVFADWNGDGDVLDTGETATAQTVGANGSSNVTFSLTPPAATTTGTKYLRIRITEGSTAPSFSGASALKGEVEDYAVTVGPCAPGLEHSTWAYSQVHNRLFRVSGFDDATLTVVDHGRLRYNGTVLDVIGDDTKIESMAVNNNNGRAYFVSNATIGAFSPPVLFYVDLNTVTPGSANLINITAVGRITGANIIEASAFEPGTSTLYVANHQSAGNDFLMTVNLNTASPTTLGQITGAGFTMQSSSSLEFDAAGNLYAMDETTDDLYRINKATGAILAREDDSVGSTVESVLWDPNSQRMIGFDSGANTVLHVTLGSNGANPDLANYPAPVNGPNQATPYDFAAVDNFQDSATDFGDWNGVADASSLIHGGVRLGALVDPEVSATKNAAASGDDTTGSDDEDGVTFPTLTLGQSGNITVTATNTCPGPAYLNAWIDFNNNGSFADAGEQIATDVIVASGTNGGSVTVPVTVPAGASAGTDRGSRFRLTTTSSPGATGASGTGEVEDYGVTLSAASDYGDYPSFASASQTASADIRMGTAATDAEAANPSSGTATADDTTGTDDEDLTMPSFSPGAATNLTIPVTLTTAALSSNTARINVYADWNGDGDVLDTGETAAPQAVSANGLSNVTFSLTPPASTITGMKYLRIRITEGNNAPAFSGSDSGDGEVEDYAVSVGTGLSLGNLVWNDANANGQKDGAESGIDNLLVELWSPGADNAIGGTGANLDTKLTSTNTSGGGLYLFSNLAAGWYFVKVPTPPLSRVSPVIDTADNGEDNDNNGSQPGGPATSAYSPVIQLTLGQEPPPSGTTSSDTTVDFGFVSNIGSPLACDNQYFHIQNVETFAGSGIYDATLYHITSAPAFDPIITYPGKMLNGLAYYAGYIYCMDQRFTHLYRIDASGTLVDMGAIPGFPDLSSIGQTSGGTASTNGKMIVNTVVNGVNSPFDDVTTFYTIDLGSASLVGAGVTLKDATGTSTRFGNLGDIAWDPRSGKLYGYLTGDASWAGLYEINPTTGASTKLAAGLAVNFGSLVIEANGLAHGYGAADTLTTSPQNTLYSFGRNGVTGLLDGSMTPLGTGPSTGNSDGASCPGAPPSMTIGNLVWNDVNNNGLKDAGESGINGVTVQLFLGGQDPTTATPAATTVTAGGGLYTFANVSPGQYFLYIPTPPAALNLSSTTTNTNDDTVDNDDNGIQTSAGAPLRSPNISLVAGTESTTDGDASADTNLTVDFGFATTATTDFGDYPSFGSASQAASADIRIGTAATDAEASNPSSGSATADDTTGSDDEDLAMPSFMPGAATNLTIPVTLTTASLSGNTARINVFADWNADGDVLDTGEIQTAQTVNTNGTSNVTFALTPPAATTMGIKYLRVRLTEGSIVPNFSGGSVLKGEVEDYAIAVGPACDGAKPILWVVDEEGDVPGHLHLWSFYDYDNPTLTSTDYGRLKYRRPSDNAIIDMGENPGDLEAMAINRYTGQAYFLFSTKLTGGPSGHQALLSYNLNDAAANQGNIILTLLGHLSRPTAGFSLESLAYDPIKGYLYTADPRDADQNISTTTDQLYRLDLRNLNANPMLGSTWTLVGTMTGASQSCHYTDGLEFAEDGKLYAVDGVDDHVYEINPSTGAIVSVTDASVNSGLSGSPDIESLAWDEINNRLIGVDNNTSGSNGHRFVEISLGSNGANAVRGQYLPGTPNLPSDADFEAAAMWNSCPAQPQLGVGNLVFRDLNNDGNYDAGEGVDGVTVELYPEGSVIGASAPVATNTTSGGGKYQFTRLLAGSYFVHIPASNFGAGKPLAGMLSMSGTNAGDDNAGEDGVDNATPAANGISSAVFALTNNSEPTGGSSETGFANTDDDSDDDNTDLTLDFGFIAPGTLGVGNVVFRDLNGDGNFDAGEGIGGAKVRLYLAGGAEVNAGADGVFGTADDTPGGVTTNSSGGYLFSGLPAGTYYVKIPASEFAVGMPLAGLVSMTGAQVGDDNLGEDGVDDSSLLVNGIRTADFSLADNTEPTDGGAGALAETGYDKTADNADDNNTDLTMDLGFVTAPATSVLLDKHATVDGGANWTRNTSLPADQVFTYRIRYSFPGTTASYSGVVVTDVLPTPLQYVGLDDSPHATGSYNAGTRTVSFVFPDPISAGATGEFRVRVKFPAGTAVGTTTNNVAMISAASGIPVAQPSPTVTVAVAATGSGTGTDAWIYWSDDQLPIGAGASFDAGFANLGGSTLNNFTVIVDPIPVQFVTERLYTYPGTNPGQPFRLHYKTTTNSTWQEWPGGPFPWASDYRYVSEIGLPVGVYLTAVKQVFEGTIPASFWGSLGFHGDVSTKHYNGFERNILGGNVVAGQQADACVAVTATHPVTSATYSDSACDPGTIVAPRGVYDIAVWDNGDGTYAPGEVFPVLVMMQSPPTNAVTMTNPTAAIVLPPQLEYVGNPNIWTNWNWGWTPVLPNINVTSNFRGTGKQLVNLSYAGFSPAVELQGDTLWREIYIYFDVRVKPGTPSGSYDNNAYGYVQGPAGTVCETTGQADTLDVDNDGNSSEVLCFYYDSFAVGDTGGNMIDKTAAASTASIGSGFYYDIQHGHNNNGTLNNYEVTDDPLPKEFVMENWRAIGKFGANIPYRAYYKTTTNGSWTEWPGGPFNSDDTATTRNVSSLGLPASVYLTGIKFNFGNLPNNSNFRFTQGAAFRLMGDVSTFHKNGQPNDVHGVAISEGAVMRNGASAGGTEPGAPRYYGETDCVNATVIAPTAIYDVVHDIVSGSVTAGSTIRVRLSVESPPENPLAFQNPALVEMLSSSLEYLGNVTVTPPSGLSVPAPVVTVTPDFGGLGRTVIRFSWANASPAVVVAPNTDWRRIDVEFDARIKPGTTNATYVNRGFAYVAAPSNATPEHTPTTDVYDFDQDGSVTDTIAFEDDSFTVTGGAGGLQVGLNGVLQVKGELDAAWSSFPTVGQTVAGGGLDYRMRLTNPGDVTMVDIDVIDILPWVGDRGVVDLNPRGSQWTPVLSGPVAAPLGITVYYSVSNNPERDELTPGVPADRESASWSTTPPADITTVRSLRFDFNATAIEPGQEMVFQWPMRVPNTAPLNQVAWNSIGFAATRADDNSRLLASEPAKVGVQVMPPVGADIGDFVWLDADKNGVQNAGEPGINGVTVRLYQPAGASPAPATDTVVDTTVTNNGGSYLFPNLSAGNYYVVFFPPADHAGSPKGAGTATDSDGSPTTIGGAPAYITSIMAIPANTVNRYVDQGFFSASGPPVGPDPVNCPTDVMVATPCYVNGNPLANGTAGEMDALVVFHYNSSDWPSGANYTPPLKAAKAKDVGACWAVAYRPQSDTLYAASVLRRYSGFGPRGIDGLYAINLASLPTTITGYDLGPLGVDAGVDPRNGADPANALPANLDQPSWDSSAYNLIGKIGLGGMDLSPDGNTLWVMNLAQRELVQLNVSGGAPTLIAKRALPIPNVANSGDIRPWAVKAHRDKVYVGMVHSAETSQNAANLRAYIYAFNGSTWSPVYDFSLNYPRGSAATGYPGEWNPWTNAHYADWIYPQPILADIEIDVDGSMILGFTDRYSLQMATANYGPDHPNTTLREGASAGDILRLCNVGGVYMLENNAAAPGGPFTGGAGNGQGPGGGEYYWGEWWNWVFDPLNPSGGYHQEIALGGLGFLPGSGHIAAAMFNPLENTYMGGIGWLSNTGGNRVNYTSAAASGISPNGLTEWNVITELDLNASSSVEGKTFVGRDFVGPSSASLGTRLSGFAASEGAVHVVRDILAGSAITVNSGGLRQGGALLGGRVLNFPGGGGRVVDASLSAASVWTRLHADSTDWKNLAADSSVSVPGAPGQLTFNCAPGADGIAVFNVSGATVFSNGNVTQMDINAGVASAILINVSGASINWTNGNLVGNFANAAWRSRIVWNFHEATSINFNAREMMGSVLAPLAAVTTTGPINGSMAARSLNTTNEVRLPRFVGGLPTSATCVSSPRLGYQLFRNPGIGAGKTSGLGDLEVYCTPTERVGIGNLVYRDSNENGRFDSGVDQPKAGVAVQLFKSGAVLGVDSPLTATETANDGTYLFKGLPPGQYFVHLPAINFLPGYPLENLKSYLGNGTTLSTDDNSDENGVDTATPTTSGVSGIVYNLQPNTAPTAANTETGYGASRDDCEDDDDINLTADFAFVPLNSSVKPATWPSWQSNFASVLGAETGPHGNSDKDIWDNLLEYGLCLSPQVGVRGLGGFSVGDTGTNVEAVFYRRKNGLSDVTYKLLGRSTLPLTDSDPWTTLKTIPGTGAAPSGVAVVDVGSGIERVTVQALQTLTPLTPSVGFVVLRVELNDGSNAFSYTDTYGWGAANFVQNHFETHSQAFAKPDVFSGTVDAATGNTLVLTTSAGGLDLNNSLNLATTAYFLEVIDGDNEGHRFDVTGAGIASLTLAVDTNLYQGPPFNTKITSAGLPGNLAGDKFVVRPHHTLEQIFPKSVFTARSVSNDLGSPSDRVYFTDGISWRVYWLYDGGGSNPMWDDDGDATIADADATVVPPGEGMFTLSQNASLSYRTIGVVRKHDFVVALRQGHTFVGGGFPQNESPADRNMLASTFDGHGTTADLADQIFTWKGDGVTAGYEEAFQGLYLIEGAGTLTNRWSTFGDTTLAPRDYDKTVFRSGRAAVIYRANGPLIHRCPLSWCVPLIGE